LIKRLYRNNFNTTVIFYFVKLYIKQSQKGSSPWKSITTRMETAYLYQLNYLSNFLKVNC